MYHGVTLELSSEDLWLLTEAVMESHHSTPNQSEHLLQLARRLESVLSSHHQRLSHQPAPEPITPKTLEAYRLKGLARWQRIEKETIARAEGNKTCPLCACN